MDSIIDFAASPHYSVDAAVMPTTFSYATTASAAVQPQAGRPPRPCPPRNPHCVPEPSPIWLLVIAAATIYIRRMASKRNPR